MFRMIDKRVLQNGSSVKAVYKNVKHFFGKCAREYFTEVQQTANEVTHKLANWEQIDRAQCQH